MRIAAGCDEVAAREALTPAMIAWLCERAARGPRGRDGRGQRPLATAGMLSSDEELDAFATDACWLAHAFIEDAPRAGAGRRLDQIQRRRRRNETTPTATMSCSSVPSRKAVEPVTLRTM